MGPVPLSRHAYGMTTYLTSGTGIQTTSVGKTEMGPVGSGVTWEIAG